MYSVTEGFGKHCANNDKYRRRLHYILKYRYANLPMLPRAVENSVDNGVNQYQVIVATKNDCSYKDLRGSASWHCGMFDLLWLPPAFSADHKYYGILFPVNEAHCSIVWLNPWTHSGCKKDSPIWFCSATVTAVRLAR